MKLFATAVVAFVAAFAFACGTTENTRNTVTVNSTNSTNASAPAVTPLPSGTVDQLASGRRIYEASCANCHKPDGKGGPMEVEGKKIDPDDLTSAKIKGFSDEKILGYIMNGIEDEGMPAFKGKLSEAEMRDVVQFIRVELQGMPMPNKPASGNTSAVNGAPANTSTNRSNTAAPSR